MMARRSRFSLLIILAFFGISYSCREISVPKPKGYIRIDLPEKKYIIFDQMSPKKTGMPFYFEYPSYGKISYQQGDRTQPGWFNIEFPAYRAKIYFTYKDVISNLDSLMEQTYKLNIKSHIALADAINQQVYNNQENKVYGILYDLKGNTASAVQFYVTDSVNHYLRGSLYFSAEPNADSLAPVIEFFREDILHLIETLKWNK
jgi:gliding motility-associated lipoprotein GldD